MFNRDNLAKPLIKYLTNLLLIIISIDPKTSPNKEPKSTTNPLSPLILSMIIYFMYYSM